jgi:hypothetical protein
MQMYSGLKFNLYEVLETTPNSFTVIKINYPDHYYIYTVAINDFNMLPTHLYNSKQIL